MIIVNWGCFHRPPKELDDPNVAQTKNLEKSLVNLPSSAGSMGGTWEPLPSSYLSEIGNPEKYLDWTLAMYGYDTSTPPKYVYTNVTLSNEQGILFGAADIPGSDDSFYHTFPSNQAFIDLIGYMYQHQDIFFDYSEFNGAPPGEFILPQGAEEYFQLTLAGYDVYGHDYCIAKGLVNGGPNPPEIEYVFNEIKTEFLNEILLHPYIPSEPRPNPPWQFRGGGD